MLLFDIRHHVGRQMPNIEYIISPCAQRSNRSALVALFSQQKKKIIHSDCDTIVTRELPCEIHHLILRHLSIVDIFHARAVSRWYYQACLEHISVHLQTVAIHVQLRFFLGPIIEYGPLRLANSQCLSEWLTWSGQYTLSKSLRYIHWTPQNLFEGTLTFQLHGREVQLVDVGYPLDEVSDKGLRFEYQIYNNRLRMRLLDCGRRSQLRWFLTWEDQRFEVLIPVSVLIAKLDA